MKREEVEEAARLLRERDTILWVLEAEPSEWQIGISVGDMNAETVRRLEASQTMREVSEEMEEETEAIARRRLHGKLETIKDRLTALGVEVGDER